jgi:hypothetical protein
MRRTMITVSDASLETLEAEARRRGVVLGALLTEAIHEKAASVRAARPSVGVGRSDDGLSAAALAADPVAEPPA